MPKLKTNKGAAKRFKITKSGKVMRKKAGKGHLLTGKSKKRKRHMRKSVALNKVDAYNIKQIMPYGRK